MKTKKWREFKFNVLEWNVNRRVGRSLFTGEKEYNPALTGIDKLKHQNLRVFRRLLK
jgi:hypothetical protein